MSLALPRTAPDMPLNLLLAALVLAGQPMLFQRHIVAGLTAGGGKG